MLQNISWISVDEMIPDISEKTLESEKVLISVITHNIDGEEFRRVCFGRVIYYKGITDERVKVWTAEKEDFLNHSFRVTHWMPIPELPE